MSAAKTTICAGCGRPAVCKARADVRIQTDREIHIWRAWLCHRCAVRFARAPRPNIGKLLRQPPVVERRDTEGAIA